MLHLLRRLTGNALSPTYVSPQVGTLRSIRTSLDLHTQGQQMIIPDGYSDIPNGKTAAVVTYLQMFERPPARPARSDQPWTFHRIEKPEINTYCDLFRRVGEEWLWFSRAALADDDLLEILNHPLIENYAFGAQGTDEGLIELDFRAEGECELSFFGLTAPLVGQGAGRWLMNQVLNLVWSRPITRFWVHTCTLDHPAALAFYIRSGFVPYRRQIEVANDPRFTGVFPKSAAPQVPLI